MVNVTTRLVPLWVTLKPSMPIRPMVFPSLKPGPPPTTWMARSNSTITLPVSVWCHSFVFSHTHRYCVEGLKLELLTSLLPATNEKTAKVNATYKKPNVHTVATLDVFKVKSYTMDDLLWMVCVTLTFFYHPRRPTLAWTPLSANKASLSVVKLPTMFWTER